MPNSIGPEHSHIRSPGRLDIRALEDDVALYFSKGLAQSSTKVYGSAAKRFMAFCSQLGVSRPLPVTEELLCRFVAMMGREGLKHSTIKVYLSGVRFYQIAQGLGGPQFQGSGHLSPTTGVCYAWYQAGSSRGRREDQATTAGYSINS